MNVMHANVATACLGGDLMSGDTCCGFCSLYTITMQNVLHNLLCPTLLTLTYQLLHAYMHTKHSWRCFCFNATACMHPAVARKHSSGSAGRAGAQATHRSRWSLHSITFSTADAIASKDAKQLTLSQMTWSMEHARQS